MSVDELVELALKYKAYYGSNGGVTLSGGEPTAQAEFAKELFSRLREHSIHTALDTAGPIMNDAVKALLSVTDLVILDIKSTDPDEFRRITGGELSNTLAFLSEVTGSPGLPVTPGLPATPGLPDLWIRQVIIKDLNDDLAHIHALSEFLKDLDIQKVELLGSVPNLNDLQKALDLELNTIAED